MGSVFTAFDSDTARDEAGGTVRLLDDGLFYERGDRTLTIPIEVLYDEGIALIYAASIRAWDVPHREAIGSIEREGILSEVAEALAALGVKFRIEA
jgi:hypothetical protein